MKKRKNLSVRFAEKSDAEEVLALALDHEKGSDIDKPAFLETFEDMLESPDYFLVVLVDDDALEIIGFAVMLKIRSLFDAPKVRYRIDMMMVRGTDFLLKPILEFLEDTNLFDPDPVSFSLTTTRNKLFFFESVGYKPAGKKDDDGQESQINLVKINPS